MSFTQDVRHSLRSLRRTPRSTTLAMLTLALGIRVALVGAAFGMIGGARAAHDARDSRSSG